MGLTYDEIDALCGRELDAHVAAAIFDWQWMRKTDGLCALIPPSAGDHERVNWYAPSWYPVSHWPEPSERFSDWDRAGVRHDSRHTVTFLPHYADDMGEAWRIVTRIRKSRPSSRFAFSDYLWTALDTRLPRMTGRRERKDLLLYVEPSDICRAAVHAALDCEQARAGR